MTREQRLTADQALTIRLHSWINGLAVKPRTIAGYLPMPGEPGGPFLTDLLSTISGALLLPVLRADRDLDWACHGGADERLTASPHAAALREPAGPRRGPAVIAEADLIVVPALCVDQQGMRLGRGGGSFDRALARVGRECPVVALLYDGELRDRLPTEAHDRGVCVAITPSGIVEFAGNSVSRMPAAGASMDNDSSPPKVGFSGFGAPRKPDPTTPSERQLVTSEPIE